jgi:hypothetical protein
LHQATELLLGLLLVYAAMHETGPSTLALFVIGGCLAALALVAPGALAIRQRLGHRGHRVGDLVLASACIGTSIAITRLDLLASVPLLVAAPVLIRLGLSRLPEMGQRRASVPTAVDRSDSGVARRVGELVAGAQPALNRAARAAGVVVRNRRARGGR